MRRSSDIRRMADYIRGCKDFVGQQLTQTKRDLRITKRDLANHENARELVKEVGMQTQALLGHHISDIASLALESVFDNPYQLDVQFVDRRNKTECDLLFIRDKEEIHPFTASGGGAVDVTAFALRVASFSMKYPKIRNIVLLDEPFRFLSKDLQDRASEMIKQVSEKLGVQFIIITHEPTLGLHADQLKSVTNRVGVSTVK